MIYLGLTGIVYLVVPTPTSAGIVLGVYLATAATDGFPREPLNRSFSRRGMTLNAIVSEGTRKNGGSVLKLPMMSKICKNSDPYVRNLKR